MDGRGARPAGAQRFAMVEGVRAVAALMIVLDHTGAIGAVQPDTLAGSAMTRLNAGVAVFFVLSGFLLYRPFVAARLAGAPAPGLGRYLRRRLLRIVPAYYAAAVLGALFLGVGGVLTHDWWAHAAFLQAYGFSGGIAPAWSLCTEMSFYLALPVYAVVCGRRLAGRPAPEQLRAELCGLALIAAISLVERELWFARAPRSAFAPTLAANAAWFAAGMALAVLSAHGAGVLARVARRPGAAWLAAGAIYAAATVALRGTPAVVAYAVWQNVTEHVLFAAFAVALVLPAVVDANGLPRRVLTRPVMAWLGTISYGIFLWHFQIAERLAHAWWPGVGLAALTAATLVASVTAGAASFYAIERPALRLRLRGDGPGLRHRALDEPLERAPLADGVLPAGQG
jgi:peptidoglycan/LPS O-acetylase OafA/YrhL